MKVLKDIKNVLIIGSFGILDALGLESGEEFYKYPYPEFAEANFWG